MQRRVPPRVLSPLAGQSTLVTWGACLPRRGFSAVGGMAPPQTLTGPGEGSPHAPPGLSTDARTQGRLDGAHTRFHSQVVALVNAARSGAVSGAQISDAIEQLLLSGSLEAVVAMLESLADVEASGSLGMFIGRGTIRRAMQVASFQNAVGLADRLVGLAIRAPQYRLDAATVELYASIIAQLRSGDHLRGIAFCALMEELGITSAFASYVHAVRKARGAASVRALCETLVQESESTFSNPYASLLRVLRAVGSLGSSEVAGLAHGALQAGVPLLGGGGVSVSEADGGAVASLVAPVLAAYASALIQASQPLDAGRLVLQASTAGACNAGSSSRAGPAADAAAAALTVPFFGGVDATPVTAGSLLHRTLTDAAVSDALGLGEVAAEAVRAMLFSLASDGKGGTGATAATAPSTTDPDFWPLLTGNAHLAIVCGDALDSGTLRELLTALDGGGRAREMAALVDAVRAVAPGRLRSFHVERTLTALVRAGEEGTALSLLEWLLTTDHRRTSRRLRATPRAFYALMHAAAARGDKAAARTLIERMQASGVVPDATILSAIATFKESSSSSAVAEAGAAGAAPGQEAQQPLASPDSTSSAARYVAAADDLLERAVTSITGRGGRASSSSPLSQGPHFFNQVVRLYCAGGRPDKAIEVLDYMADFDVRPGPDTLRTFLTGFALCGPQSVTGLQPDRVPGAWGGLMAPEAYATAKAAATAQRSELAAFLGAEATRGGADSAPLPPFADGLLLGEVGRLLSDWRLDTAAAAASARNPGSLGVGDATSVLRGFVLPRFSACVATPWGVVAEGEEAVDWASGIDDETDVGPASCALTHVRLGPSPWSSGSSAASIDDASGFHTDEEDVEAPSSSPHTAAHAVPAVAPDQDWLPLVATSVLPRLVTSRMAGAATSHRVADSLVSWAASFLPPARTLALFHAMHQDLALYGPHLAASADWASLSPALCVIDVRQCHVASAAAFAATWLSALWREALAKQHGEKLDTSVWSSGWDGKADVLLVCGARGSKLRAAMPHVLAAAAGHSPAPAHVEVERGVLLKASALHTWLAAEKKRCAAGLA